MPAATNARTAGGRLGHVQRRGLAQKSIFALKQDTRELGANIVELGGEFLRKIAKKHNMKSEDIDWLLPHLSSMFFREQIKTKLDAIGLPIGDEHWFINLPRIGNVAAVSALAMVDDIFTRDKFCRRTAPADDDS